MEQLKFDLKGVGADAEIETNANGGMQSKTEYSMHLIDPKFLREFSVRARETFAVDGVEKYSIVCAMEEIAEYMEKETDKEWHLMSAVFCLANPINLSPLAIMGEVLKEGAEKYAPNNWRKIPEEEHLNHALIHLVAAYNEDKTDNHLAHAVTRLMMAFGTNISEDFSYTECKV